MKSDHTNEPRIPERKRSALRLISNLAWLLGVGSILAPSLLDLSASGRDTANVLFGIAFFVFFLCVIAGFVRAAEHYRSRGKADLSAQQKQPDEGA
ncbi:hypothetical protein [Ideonella sp.]|jgi:hypothetical protein|uniref:hypothetical protein n=1 Tax=Ideonella sp. TaxID=1929293 RepID=UPI0037C0A51B